MTSTSLPKLSYSIAETVTATGMSKTHLSDAIRSGRLKARKSSLDDNGEPQGKYVILHEDLVEYLRNLPEA